MLKTISIVILLGFGIFILITLLVFFIWSKPPCRALFIKPLCRFNTKETIVALTFDDGPSAEWTPPLLDLLKKYSVNATFFLIGEKIERYPDIIKRMIKEKHQLGHHTYNHTRNLFRTKSFIRNDISKMDQLFRRFGIEAPRIYRPPYGTKMFALPLVLKERKMHLVTWDVDPKSQYDNKQMKMDEIYNEVMQNVKPGSIILLHDGWSGDPEPFLKSVEKIIIELKNKGYQFITIEDGINKYGLP